MQTILIILLIEIAYVINMVGFYFLFKRTLNKLEKEISVLEENISGSVIIQKRLFEVMNNSIQLVHQRIDKIFAVDQANAPNEATQKTDPLEDLDENNIHGIPDGVKFEVEGGDTNVPPEYPEK